MANVGYSGYELPADPVTGDGFELAGLESGECLRREFDSLTWGTTYTVRDCGLGSGLASTFGAASRWGETIGPAAEPDTVYIFTANRVCTEAHSENSATAAA